MAPTNHIASGSSVDAASMGPAASRPQKQVQLPDIKDAYEKLHPLTGEPSTDWHSFAPEDVSLHDIDTLRKELTDAFPPPDSWEMAAIEKGQTTILIYNTSFKSQGTDDLKAAKIEGGTVSHNGWETVSAGSRIEADINKMLQQGCSKRVNTSASEESYAPPSDDPSDDSEALETIALHHSPQIAALQDLNEISPAVDFEDKSASGPDPKAPSPLVLTINGSNAKQKSDSAVKQETEARPGQNAIVSQVGVKVYLCAPPGNADSTSEKINRNKSELSSFIRNFPEFKTDRSGTNSSQPVSTSAVSSSREISTLETKNRVKMLQVKRDAFNADVEVQIKSEKADHASRMNKLDTKLLKGIGLTEDLKQALCNEEIKNQAYGKAILAYQNWQLEKNAKTKQEFINTFITCKDENLINEGKVPAFHLKYYRNNPVFDAPPKHSDSSYKEILYRRFLGKFEEAAKEVVASAKASLQK
ncbi:hypothetical protein [Noviherbaspirillum galbum]|uniref:Uncharacterized protein n=1 Tax=Noviherbaspirillum galbum TaxID=2709383 RepID=A0A6B3SG09_9BURK|nr:hypothetical protein [Noviherbaspirillum galbum]NEX59817.1 hypothetical protein [Noviherbaspirillum galbum]